MPVIDAVQRKKLRRGKKGFDHKILILEFLIGFNFFHTFLRLGSKSNFFLVICRIHSTEERVLIVCAQLVYVD